MNIQELYDEIDNQYNLYISEEGAYKEICDNLMDMVSNLVKNGELFKAPNFMNYYFKISNILLHRETGVLIRDGVKRKYIRDGNKVIVQIYMSS